MKRARAATVVNNLDRILVTTAIEETWGSDQKIFFIGEWCKKYTRMQIWERRQYQVMPYHWQDRVKQANDCVYIEDLYEKLLQSLAIALNAYHNKDFSLRYWRVVLGPWLLEFIAVIWDRWESLRLAFANFDFDSSYVSEHDLASLIPLDYPDSIKQHQADFWNHVLFSYIIKHAYEERIRLESLPQSTIDVPIRNASVVKYSLKFNLAYYVDKLLGALKKEHTVILVSSYFPQWSLLRLLARLREFPRLYLDFSKQVPMRPPASKRENLQLDYSAESDFETFLLKIISDQIPVIYLEGYSAVQNVLSKGYPKAKVILTANAHYSNDLFKFWCAGQLENGAKLLVANHGGAIPSWHTSFNMHEDKISDRKIVWYVPLHDLQVRLPPSKLMDPSYYNTKGEDLSLIGFDQPRYVHRSASNPVSSLLLEDFNQKIQFTKLLAPDIKRHLRIRLNPDRGWNLRQRIADELGEEKISKQKSIHATFEKSKIVICTYPQTTFLEAMNSNVPTILLYSKHLWSLRPEFDELVKELEGAKIIFADPKLAAEHINAVWANPSEWWGRQATMRSREKFLTDCGRFDKKWLEKWNDFLTGYSRAQK